MPLKTMSIHVLRRLPRYLNYLRALPKQTQCISATQIADALRLNNVQVRKDLALVSSGAKPRVGYKTSRLLQDIEALVEGTRKTDFVIVGMGSLGTALAQYNGFQNFGMQFTAGFDSNTAVIGNKVGDIYIKPVAQVGAVCADKNVQVGIITVPKGQAQYACDSLVQAGVSLIINYAPMHLLVPEEVHVEYINMAAALANLTHHIAGIEKQ